MNDISADACYAQLLWTQPKSESVLNWSILVSCHWNCSKWICTATKANLWDSWFSQIHYWEQWARPKEIFSHSVTRSGFFEVAILFIICGGVALNSVDWKSAFFFTNSHIWNLAKLIVTNTEEQEPWFSDTILIFYRIFKILSLFQPKSSVLKAIKSNFWFKIIDNLDF